MTQKKEIEEEYQRKNVVEVFDKERQKYLFQRYKHKIESNFLKKTIKSVKKKKVEILDVACGTGRMLPEVFSTKKDISYTGLDSSKEMVKQLKIKANKARVQDKINIKLGDATKLPFEENTFDVTYTFHLTWHLPQELQSRMISEMLRVTKKGGYVIFDLLNENFIWEKYKWLFGKDKTGGIYKINVKRIKRKLKRYNYDLEKLSDFPIKNSFIYTIFNLTNLLRKILPLNLFHMVFFRVKK